MVIRPADRLHGQLGDLRQRHDHGPREVEDDVVAGAGEPHHDVVLRRRQRVARRADHWRVEPADSGRCGVGSDARPQLRPEPGDEVDTADCRPRLSDRGDRADGARRVHLRQEVELEVGVRPGPEGEDPRLRRCHRQRRVRGNDGLVITCGCDQVRLNILLGMIGCCDLVRTSCKEGAARWRLSSTDAQEGSP
jgi:hypothetical protein